MEDNIQKDIIAIINMIKRCHSKSMYNVLLGDLSKLYYLADILNIDVLDVDDFSYKNYPFNYKKVEIKQKNFYIKNYDFNRELVENYKDVLNKKLNPIAVYELPILSDKKIEEYVKEFLLSYDNKIYDLYKKYNDRIIYVKDKIEEEALTFYGNFFDPYILIEKENTIFTILRLIHELGHVVDFNNSFENNYNYTGEIYSHFNELIYMDYQCNELNYENIKKNYLYHLKDTIDDLDKLLNTNISTNSEFRKNYSKIYYILEYTYGMILALNFYDEYDFSFKDGLKMINKFSIEKNNIRDIIDLIHKFHFDIDEIKSGDIVEKILFR